MPPGKQVSRATKLVQRRMFLKAMALGMSVPAAMRLARFATAAPTTAPKRFFLMFIPHGTAPEHFQPRINNATVDPTMTATYSDFGAAVPLGLPAPSHTQDITP